MATGKPDLRLYFN